MPELPDITVYLDSLRPRILGHEILGAQVLNPFALRTVTPPLSSIVGKRVKTLSRLGKRIVIGVDGDVYVVIHLMIAGRLRWRVGDKKIAGKLAQAVFEFDTGRLYLTEAGSKRRASIHVVEGADSLKQFDRGGLEVLDADLGDFAARLRSENHTIKRSLTDPRLFSGIGNSYSDEILHRAKMSPMTLTSRMTDQQIAELFEATKATLIDWTDRLRKDAGDEFPEKVTAFRDGMAVHGRYKLPCPVCGSPVQRIRYADNETNYCARCQTGGRLLADRAMSRLLKQDWPRSIDEVE
jgi:formamidopyrimidine-DNA glycosylase